MKPFFYAVHSSLHVTNDQHDLLSPKDELIMPSIWDPVIEPGWEITMHMSPIPEPHDPLADDTSLIMKPGVPPRHVLKSSGNQS